MIIYSDQIKPVPFFYDDDKMKLDFILGYLPFILGYFDISQKIILEYTKKYFRIPDIWGHLFWDMGYLVPPKQASILSIRHQS